MIDAITGTCGPEAAGQDLGDRLTQELALQIPQRHVDRADRERRDSLDAVPERVATHLTPQLLHVERVAVAQQRRKRLLDEDLGGA